MGWNKVGSRAHRHTSVTLEDLHGCVEADSRQLRHVKHVVAARAARDRRGLYLSHGQTLYQATNQRALVVWDEGAGRWLIADDWRP